MKIGVLSGASSVRRVVCCLAMFALSLGVSCPSTLASEAGGAAALTSVDPLEIPADDTSISVVDSNVVDEAGESIGEITALILTPSNEPIFAILSVGAFLGVGQKFVIVRTSALKLVDGKSMLLGGTKASLTALPSYARRE